MLGSLLLISPPEAEAEPEGPAVPLDAAELGVRVGCKTTRSGRKLGAHVSREMMLPQPVHLPGLFNAPSALVFFPQGGFSRSATVSQWLCISSTDETQSTVTAGTSTAKQLWLDGAHPQPRCTQTCSVPRTSTTAETPGSVNTVILRCSSRSRVQPKFTDVEGKGKVLLHH